jgi:predicted HicB family RNase H-like nuclease
MSVKTNDATIILRTKKREKTLLNNLAKKEGVSLARFIRVVLREKIREAGYIPHNEGKYWT